jgi:hypothetical protein
MGRHLDARRRRRRGRRARPHPHRREVVALGARRGRGRRRPDAGTDDTGRRLRSGTVAGLDRPVRRRPGHRPDGVRRAAARRQARARRPGHLPGRPAARGPERTAHAAADQPGDHLPRAVGRRRVDPARHARLHLDGEGRLRPPHGQLQRLHGDAGGGDGPRDLRLPRAEQRLVRHRLQLPRRPLRPGLRGPGGGIDRYVLGAHTGGFNVDSFGVSLLGDFSTVPPSAGTMATVSKVLAGSSARPTATRAARRCSPRRAAAPRSTAPGRR